MKVKYTKDGIDYNLDGIKIVLTNLVATSENQFISDEQLGSFIQATDEFQHEITNRVNRASYFKGFDEIQNYNNDYKGDFYKFISSADYYNYFKFGRFRLGSLPYYRGIEKEESRDEVEGHCNVVLETDKRQIITKVISGYNYYVLCGTKNLDEVNYMKKQFGGYVIKITNMNSFANKVKRSLGAVSWKLNEIQYTDFKCFKCRTFASDTIKDLSSEKPQITEPLVRELLNLSSFPSLFSKPVFFEKENEVRLVLEMKKNVNKTINIENASLLHDVEIIKS